MNGRVLLSTYLRPQWRRVVLLAALLAFGIGLAVVNPQIVRFFIDSALAHASGTPLLIAALVFLGAAVVRQGVMMATDYVGEVIAWKSTNALRADLALHCLRLDMPFHKIHPPGELIERIDGDVSALSSVLSYFGVRLVGNGLLVLAILLALFAENWRVGAGISLYALLALVLLWRLHRLGVAQWAASRQAEAEYSGFLEERLLGTEDIRSSGAERHILDRLDRLSLTMLRTHRTARLVSNVTYIVMQGVHSLAYALGLGIGAALYLQGQITLGGAYLIVNYVALLATPLDELRFQIQNLQQANASLGRVAALFAIQPSVADGSRAVLPSGPLAVELDGVSFKYDEANLALDGISLRVEPGEVLGVLGRTGSGKSTLTRLLFRLYDPQAGSIRLGNCDIRDVGVSDLRNHIALVTQDVQLFEASIRDNLTLFNRSIGDAQIETALRTLGLWEWVQKREGGLDGRLAPGGQGLSAGEAQLLAFARAFLKNPGAVVLDEASSRLDPGTEQLLDQAVAQLLRNRTGLIIAHRLGTVQHTDAIVIFEKGRVAEYGRREDLARNPGSRFYRLLQAGLEQALESEDPAPTAPLQEVPYEHVAL